MFSGIILQNHLNIFNINLRETRYLQMLQGPIITPLEASLLTKKNYFVLDGSTTHNSLVVGECFQEVFDKRQIANDC